MNAREPTRSRPMDQINITPFVDVCLVILLIFMVVTPLLVPGHAVRLPQAVNTTPQPQDEQALTLSVDATGALFVGEKQVDLAQLSHALRGARTENPEAPVRMMGDGRVPFGAVKGVLKAVEGAGFRQIALMAKDRSATVIPGAKPIPLDPEKREVSHDE